MIVFTYPGQGSQKPGMGRGWTSHPSWELVVEASAAADRDVERLLLSADADELTETRNSQLATFTMSMVMLDAVTRLGVEAAGHAGHSLGEYSALTSAGVLDFGDAVALVTERGNAMQAAAEEREGAMAAVFGLDDDSVMIACSRAAADVWLANHNAPGQVVIAGAPDAIETAIAIARDLGARKAVRLPVGGAFHTRYMSSARERLAKAIDCAEFRDPLGVMVANVDAINHGRGSDWPDLLKAQLTSPVRWRQTLVALDSAGFTTYVEIGPGKVLTGLARRSLRHHLKLSVSAPGDLDRLLEVLVPRSPAPQPLQSTSPAGAHADIAGRHTFEGERFFTTERLVVSPSSGVFTAAEGLDAGAVVGVGHLIGRVGDTEVRSAFPGELMDVLAVNGERVTACQPLAWLRTS